MLYFFTEAKPLRKMIIHWSIFLAVGHCSQSTILWRAKVILLLSMVDLMVNLTTSSILEFGIYCTTAAKQNDGFVSLTSEITEKIAFKDSRMSVSDSALFQMKCTNLEIISTSFIYSSTSFGSSGTTHRLRDWMTATQNLVEKSPFGIHCLNSSKNTAKFLRQIAEGWSRT